MLGTATSSREDCLYCDGPAPTLEMFDWEVLLPAEGGEERVSASGANSGQATAMDELRNALRRTEPREGAWGRITRRTYEFGAPVDDWRRELVFTAVLDLAGSVRFTRAEL
ncbi:hypothetical protein HNP84_009624 [Thermocatellispora tengchongensis]|uniref:Uncharacterized protein n=1 Tax=Thermocatellispora tengchongensis TaxID=1073253 RepID=A0A840PQ41_9ACTN|nr:hypothetical protein [Thermocatellispora tengchongensis]MBB5139860.1 hypothetical protein [Thermocatellispora tengchongensis]